MRVFAALAAAAAAETCVTLDSSRYRYQRRETTRAEIQLTLDTDNTSEYAMYDESNLKLQYSGCTFTNIQAHYPVDSATIANTQTQMIFDFHEKESGKRNHRFDVRWQASSSACQLDTVELCRGVSPTAGYLNFHNYVSSYDCEQLDTSVMTVPNVWLGRAYMRTWFRGTTAVSIKAGDYVELEFSGPIEFSNLYFPVLEAVNVMGEFDPALTQNNVLHVR